LASLDCRLDNGRLLSLWNILISALWPLLYFYKPFRSTLRQRLGHFELGKYDPKEPGLKLLINAVSAGEVNAIAPFIRELKELRPDAQVALLTTTDSGLDMARSKLAEDVELVTFFPLIDLPFASRRFLDKLRPDLYITTEAELWPNIQSQCRARGIKAALVNGRVYMHNKAGWRGTLIRKLLAMLELIVCQDERQRANFLKLGIPKNKLTVSGNIKFDFELPEWSEEKLAEWRTQLGLLPNDRVVVAGSTHPGEEARVIDACRAYDTSLKIVLAPRHVERVQEVSDLCERYVPGAIAIAYSIAISHSTDWQMLIVDRYGVLVDLYRVANVIVMGGTFAARVGGHNILEATALGKPVIVGPHIFGIASQVRMLDSVGSLEHADEDAGDLAVKLSDLFGNPARATAMGKAAKEVTDSNRGAAARAAEQVLSLFTAPTMQP
jgi:3-deoxy-D-manno-octulosonic-acid transferase